VKTSKQHNPTLSDELQDLQCDVANVKHRGSVERTCSSVIGDVSKNKNWHEISYFYRGASGEKEMEESFDNIYKANDILIEQIKTYAKMCSK
jgi:hypothetical protein